MNTDIGRRTRRPALVAAVLVLAGIATACSSSSHGGSGSAGTYTIWDPYPQFDSHSAWVRLLDTCGRDAGVTVKHTAFDTTALTSKVLLAAQQGAAPDVL